MSEIPQVEVVRTMLARFDGEDPNTPTYYSVKTLETDGDATIDGVMISDGKSGSVTFMEGSKEFRWFLSSGLSSYNPLLDPRLVARVKTIFTALRNKDREVLSRECQREFQCIFTPARDLMGDWQLNSIPRALWNNVSWETAGNVLLGIGGFALKTMLLAGLLLVTAMMFPVIAPVIGIVMGALGTTTLLGTAGSLLMIYGAGRMVYNVVDIGSTVYQGNQLINQGWANPNNPNPFLIDQGWQTWEAGVENGGATVVQVLASRGVARGREALGKRMARIRSATPQRQLRDPNYRGDIIVTPVVRTASSSKAALPAAVAAGTALAVSSKSQSTQLQSTTAIVPYQGAIAVPPGGGGPLMFSMAFAMWLGGGGRRTPVPPPVGGNGGPEEPPSPYRGMPRRLGRLYKRAQRLRGSLSKHQPRTTRNRKITYQLGETYLRAANLELKGNRPGNALAAVGMSASWFDQSMRRGLRKNLQLRFAQISLLEARALVKIAERPEGEQNSAPPEIPESAETEPAAQELDLDGLTLFGSADDIEVNGEEDNPEYHEYSTGTGDADSFAGLAEEVEGLVAVERADETPRAPLKQLSFQELVDRNRPHRNDREATSLQAAEAFEAARTGVLDQRIKTALVRREEVKFLTRAGTRSLNSAREFVDRFIREGILSVSELERAVKSFRASFLFFRSAERHAEAGQVQHEMAEMLDRAHRIKLQLMPGTGTTEAPEAISSTDVANAYLSSSNQFAAAKDYGRAVNAALMSAHTHERGGNDSQALEVYQRSYVLARQLPQGPRRERMLGLVNKVKRPLEEKRNSLRSEAIESMRQVQDLLRDDSLEILRRAVALADRALNNFRQYNAAHRRENRDETNFSRAVHLGRQARVRLAERLIEEADEATDPGEGVGKAPELYDQAIVALSELLESAEEHGVEDRKGNFDFITTSADQLAALYEQTNQPDFVPAPLGQALDLALQFNRTVDVQHFAERLGYALASLTDIKTVLHHVPKLPERALQALARGPRLQIGLKKKDRHSQHL